MSKLIDLTGCKFGKLTVLRRDSTINGVVYWLCRCECGKETRVPSQKLRIGATKSCGCGRIGVYKPNEYDLSGEYGIGYLRDGGCFIFDKEDYEIVKRYSWNIDKDGYIFSSIKNGKIKLHRLLLDCPKNMVVDHINRDPSDNRKVNLRICTSQENGWNRKFKGYTKVNGKYRVTLSKNNKLVFRQVCETESEAKRVRREAEKMYFGEYAYKENQICQKL